LISLTGFIVFYTGLAIVEGWLMLRFVKLGPSSLHTGKYHFEHDQHINHDQLTDEQGAKS